MALVPAFKKPSPSGEALLETFLGHLPIICLQHKEDDDPEP